MTDDLVLLPGLNGTCATFDAVRAALPRALHAAAIDLPALPTTRAIAEALLPRLPPRFWLAGHSFGGYVALALLQAAPQRVRGLALVCSLPGADTPAQQAKRRDAIALAAGGGYFEMATASKAAFHPDNAANEALVARRTAIVRSYGAERYIAHAQACIERPDRSALLVPALPTLLVTGSHDTVVATADVKALAQRLPHAGFAQIEGAGHLLPLEQPAALAAALAAWIGR